MFGSSSHSGTCMKHVIARIKHVRSISIFSKSVTTRKFNSVWSCFQPIFWWCGGSIMTVSLCTPHGIPLQITSSGHITFSMFRVRAGLTWRWFLKISYILAQDNMRKQKNQITQNDCQVWHHPLHQINRQSKQLARWESGGGGTFNPT